MSVNDWAFPTNNDTSSLDKAPTGTIKWSFPSDKYPPSSDKQVLSSDNTSPSADIVPFPANIACLTLDEQASSMDNIRPTIVDEGLSADKITPATYKLRFPAVNATPFAENSYLVILKILFMLSGLYSLLPV
jgi:hypothetical protein